jgi:ribosomal subunit interface protein
MDYNFKGTGLTMTEEVQTYLDKRLARIDKLLPTHAPAALAVELEYAAAASDKKYRAEYNLSIGGDLHRVEASGHTLHEAIDIAIDELTHSLSRNKKHRLHSLRRHATRLKEYMRGFKIPRRH